MRSLTRTSRAARYSAAFRLRFETATTQNNLPDFMNMIQRTVSSAEALEARIAPAVIYGVDDANHLISFDSATPATIIATTSITGLTDAAHELIKGIDFRPADGKLYALGILDADNGNGNPNEGRIYTLNTKTGALTQVGNSAFFTNFQDQDDFSFDFNPAADRIRIQTDRDDNLRVNPNTGALSGTDTDVNPAMSNIVGLAYDRNFDGTPATTLFGLDQATGNLVKIGGTDGVPSPNGGVVTTVGPTGLTFTGDYKVGFDIQSHTGIGFATVHPNGGATSLYTINLVTGTATLVGAVSGAPEFNGMTVAPPNDLKIVNPTTATYIDQDGDTVTVKVTGAAAGASLSADQFQFSTGQFGSQLKVLDLSTTHGAVADAQEFAKASVSIQAVPSKIKIGTTTITLGDSFATVGYINATGVDLGKVTVNGDLGQIDAGDTTTTTVGLASLTVQSMGVYFNSQLPSGALIPNQISDIVGKLGSLTVKSDFTREQINVTGGADGSIGNITIGGDITGTGLFASSGINSTGSIGNIKIGGSIFGGSATSVGSIIAQGTSNIGTVTIGGSIYGGDGSMSGLIEGTNIGNVIVKGSVFGGTDDFAGGIHAKGILGNVTVGGSIVGGDVPSSNEFDAGIIYTSGSKMGNVKIGGSLIGSVGSFGGSLFSAGTMGSVTIGGSLEGADGPRSAEIQATGNLGAVKIGGDMNGGTGLYSGSVVSINANIASVTVGGSVVGHGNTFTGIIAGNQLGAVKIAGSLESAGTAGVRISGQGLTTGSLAKDAKAVGAIASINITGSVKNALILGGYSIGGAGVNPDATIGAVTVGGNWIASSLVAGVIDTNADGFGNADDLKITTNEAVADVLFSKIGAITIKGFVAGTPGSVSNTDHYGFIAEQLGTLKIGVRSYALATGTDTTGFSVATTNDVFFREVV